jgi:hypothetical protein
MLSGSGAKTSFHGVMMIIRRTSRTIIRVITIMVRHKVIGLNNTVSFNIVIVKGNNKLIETLTPPKLGIGISNSTSNDTFEFGLNASRLTR